MAKYVHLSRVYLNDEEYYELLSPKNVPRTEQLRMARTRGHIFSHKANEADVRSRLATLPSDWKTVSEILKSMAKPDPEEHKSCLKICNCDPTNDLVEVAEKVKEHRNKKKEEVYSINKINENSVRVDVTYTEVDPSRALVYQRRERTLSVEITKTNDAVHFLHNANDRAKNIVDELKALFKIKPECQLREEKITLSAIRDAVLRTKFFTELIKGVTGFKYQNATHLTVDRRLVDKLVDENENGEDDGEDAGALEAAEAMKGLVHKVSLDGEQVIATELYQKAASTGYFITNVSWSCIDEKDARIYIDCEAGFSDPASAEQFSFDIVRKRQMSEDHRNGFEVLTLTAIERRGLMDLIEKSAQNALHKVTDEYGKREIPKGKKLTAAAS